jgi:orotate phosphoribosyltransferase
MPQTDEFGKHEVVHTTSIIRDMIDDHLLTHDAIRCNPKWLTQAQAAFDAVATLYSTVTADTLQRQSLQAIINAKSFRTGNFTLASGQSASYFFDLKPTMLDPAGANLIAGLILDRITDLNLTPVAVGGMATGGIPIASVVCSQSHFTARPMRAFFVRKETKDHGTENLIEGVLKPGETVVLVEDVTTTGGSIMAAVRAVRAAGCFVTHVITVVDRLEGAKENLAVEGITLDAIFTRRDFME